jgi:hypothetical protein
MLLQVIFPLRVVGPKVAMVPSANPIKQYLLLEKSLQTERE